MNQGDLRPRHGGSIAVVGAPGRCAAHIECFADDVVIDFPSVAAAVERMRSAFVEDGPRRTPLAVHITMSPKQAVEGAMVSFDVPVRCTCRECGGRGETWPDRCGLCAGTGAELRRHQVQVLVPGGVANGARFRFLVAPRHDPPTHIELRVAVR